MNISFSTTLIVFLFFVSPFSKVSGANLEETISVPALTVRQDDKRPKDQFQIQLFNRPLTIGGELETKPSDQRDVRLGLKDDDQFQADQHLELELLYALSQTSFLFIEGKMNHRKIFYAEDDQEPDQVEFQRGEMWFFSEDFFAEHWSLRVGRQNIREKREWWWDENLDAMTVLYEEGSWELEFGIAQELMKVSDRQDGIDPEEKDLLRVFTHAKWHWAPKQQLAFFFLNQDDGSPSVEVNQQISKNEVDQVDADLSWLGIRAMGRWKMGSLGKMYYWLDTAYVDGKETVFDFDDIPDGRSEVQSRVTQDVQAWAIDIGATWETELRGTPSLTLGYAIGSGDRNPNDNTNHAFRQTGLQDNNGRFSGVDRFRYYGELLRPELSNITIGTIAIGFPVLKNSSIEILYHQYRQVELKKGRLRDADIKADVLGKNKEIGQEIDVVIGLEEWVHLEVELISAFFLAGDAFGSPPEDLAIMHILKIDYNF